MVAAPGPNAFARFQKAAYYYFYLPYNSMVKNFHEDAKSGSASFFWKYPLLAGTLSYPFGFYYHENHRVNEKRDLLALGIKTQYERDLASGKIVIEDE